MDSLLLTLLPIERRLALSYAPTSARLPTLALLALDARLAVLVRATHEPMLGQIKLAWWRDRLGEPAGDWPMGEPVLAALGSWNGQHSVLGALVDGWEGVLTDQPDAIARLCKARGECFAGLAHVLGIASNVIGDAAIGWSIGDCLSRIDDDVLSGQTRQLAAEFAWAARPLPRALRPLAVLYGLARRAQLTERTALLDRPGDALAAARIGLLGR